MHFVWFSFSKLLVCTTDRRNHPAAPPPLNPPPGAVEAEAENSHRAPEPPRPPPATANRRRATWTGPAGPRLTLVRSTGLARDGRHARRHAHQIEFPLVQTVAQGSVF